ncbi:MAG: DUF1819 family protein [SAR324 cluster bacterium]|nr:DUF1819 family protein [SAR324 cluster bacterium]
MLNCTNIDPTIEGWADSTRKKLRQIIFKILAEAGYINNTKIYPFGNKIRPTVR